MIVVAKESALTLPSLLSFCFPFHPDLIWVSVFFLSAFKASGEKIGSFASSASSLTNFVKSLKVTIFIDLVCASWAGSCLRGGGFQSS